MSNDFRNVEDIHSFAADLILDASVRMGEPGIHHDIANEVTHERGIPSLSFGIDTPTSFDDDWADRMTASRMRAIVISDCVEAARRQRMARSIKRQTSRFYGLNPFPPHTPLWACHADLIIIAGFLHTGYDRSEIHLLGPARSKPQRGGRNIYRDKLTHDDAPSGLGLYHRHYVRDGYVYAHMSIGQHPGEMTPNLYGPIEILSDHRTAISIHGYDLPETVLTVLPGQPLDALLTHPVTDQIPNLGIVKAHSSEGTTQSIFVTLERRRTFLAKPPANADLSFAELGNDLLIEIGHTPVSVLPYSPDLHIPEA